MQVVAQNRRDSGQIQCLKLSNLPTIATRNRTHSSWFSTPPIATNCRSRKTNVSRTSTVPRNFDESQLPQHSHCCHSCSGTSHITTITAQQRCKKKIEWKAWRLRIWDLTHDFRIKTLSSRQSLPAATKLRLPLTLPTNVSKFLPTPQPNQTPISSSYNLTQALRMDLCKPSEWMATPISSPGLVRASKLASESM